MKQPYRILVVDDEPDLGPLIRLRMRRKIRSGVYSFEFAENGVEALEVLKQNQDIDLVITDISMPEMDGLSLLQEIPGVAGDDLRYVVVSAYGDIKNIRTAMNRGAFDFVTKPVDFDDLDVTIERTLEHLEQWREAVAVRAKLVALQNELKVASSTQQSILPKVFPRNSDYQVFGHMEPARNVGGDFYDVIQLPDNQVGLAIADVSDKGVPAALFMMASRTLLKGAAIGTVDPAHALDEVNKLLHEDNEALMFVTVLYSIYDPATGKLTYSNGGHDAPLLVRPDGSSDLLPLTNGVALGIAPDVEFSSSSAHLEPGDTVFLYTDGVTEAMNSKGEQFGLERMHDVFAASPPKSSEQAARTMFEAVTEFVGDAQQFDDITCLVLHRGEDGS